MASTRDLQPAFRWYADALLDVLRQYDHSYRITSARRTTTEQQALYDRWLAGEPGIFTPARPGYSQHERGWAVDIAGKLHPKEDELLHTLGEWWRSVGGVWGGPRDPVHFEAPKGWTGRA